MMPVATEIISAGIWAREAVADGEQREVVARLAERHVLLEHRRSTMPPSRLIATIMMPAIASPLTNFEAPSIAP